MRLTLAFLTFAMNRERMKHSPFVTITTQKAMRYQLLCTEYVTECSFDANLYSMFNNNKTAASPIIIGFYLTYTHGTY